MNKIKMFCLSMNPNHLQLIKKLNYEPVGLGNSSFSEEWMSDKSGTNISHKNSFYGEYTFHYWLWKNYLNNLPNNWIGFCQYRKFWISENILKNDLEFHELNSITLKDISKEFNNYDSILGTPFYVNQFRFSKFVKNNFKKMFFSPSLLFDKNKRNIKFHFDMMHGEGNLDKAINLLDNKDKNDFRDFINQNVSFNPHNMFICKSKKILINYYESIFPWLERCEEIFGFNNLESYGMKRIYGFLAERYMSYWFQKNTKFLTKDIYFKDISDYKI